MAGITPMRQNDTYPDAVWHFQDDLGNIVSLPNGTTFQLIIYDPKTNAARVGAGTWTATNLSQGIATYAWDTTDTATVGNFKCYAKFTVPGGKVGTTDPQDFIIQPIFVQQ
jgi:hypothetical protein